MKIGIDISQIVYGTGVSFYTRHLVESLARYDQDNNYLLVGTSLRRKGELRKFSQEIRSLNQRFQARLFSFPISLAEYWGNRARFFPLEKLIGPIDLFHSSDWIQPPLEAVRVTTIHDFSFWRSPGTSHNKISTVMRRRLSLVKKEADRIIAVSKATAWDTINLLKINPEKIRVVYEAPGEEFKKISSLEVGKVKQKYNIVGDYLLAVATIEPRKNFPQILEAFCFYLKENPDVSLVIVGRFGWDKLAVRLAKGLPRVIFTGYIPTEDLVAFYNGALCFLYPSLYEGFGLPILEAMACGCPVVTANVSSMPEIAGNSAVLVNPLSVNSILSGIKSSIDARKEWQKRGLARVKKFSWQKVARQTKHIYEEAFREKQY